jgi:hypothetical protein
MSSVIYKYQDGDTIQEIHRVVVHRFNVSDVEDPDMYAAQPMWEWENSEQGQFIMTNAIEKPEWHRHMSHELFVYNYAITAKLEKKKLSEFYLKWGCIK